MASPENSSLPAVPKIETVTINQALEVMRFARAKVAIVTGLMGATAVYSSLQGDNIVMQSIPMVIAFFSTLMTLSEVSRQRIGSTSASEKLTMSAESEERGLILQESVLLNQPPIPLSTPSVFTRAGLYHRE